MDDQPLLGGPLGRAGDQRQSRRVRHRLIGDDVVIAWFDHFGARDDVHVGPTEHGLDIDLVTGLQLVEIAEWCLVRGSVACQRCVTELPRNDRLRKMTDSAIEVVFADAGDVIEVDADLRDRDPADAVAVFDKAVVLPRGRPRNGGCRGGSNRRGRADGRTGCAGNGRRGNRRRRNCRRRNCRRPGGRGHDGVRGARQGVQLGFEGGLEMILRPCRLDARAPQLIRHEPEHQEAERDQTPADVTDDPAPVVWFWGPVPPARTLAPLTGRGN